LDHSLGPKRDCEFNLRSQTTACSSGLVTLSCSISASAKSQVLRVCEASVVLGAGTACRFNDQHLLANLVLTPGVASMFSFQCPSARDSAEVGGLYSTYSGPAWNKDAHSPITCSVV
jgi:hypothetical protein